MSISYYSLLPFQSVIVSVIQVTATTIICSLIKETDTFADKKLSDFNKEE